MLLRRRLRRSCEGADAEPSLLSGLPRIVDDTEGITRFLTSHNHFSTKKNVVKAAAFVPSGNDETSVFRHSGDPRDEMWQIGRDQIVAKGRSLRGAGIVRAHHIRSAGLLIDAAEPPPRHGVITGWPIDNANPDEQRARRLDIASMLAQHAELVLR